MRSRENEGRAFPAAGEWLGWLALAALAAFFVATSWRRWPDPLIDFGRELYLPWQLSHGAVLYRDVEDYYGPLSQYFNAGLFASFGPGLMVLAAANLAVFAGIVTTLYALYRRAWGAGAAFVSSSVFVCIFGFAQYTVVANYNYATPYSHETTHGLLVCLLLVLVLVRWTEHPTILSSFLTGGLFGLTAVLKPEILLAAGLVTLAAWAMRWRSVSPAAMAAWLGGSALPTLAFAAYFWRYVPGRDAFVLACRAWLNLGSGAGHTLDPIQRAFLGFDHFGPNLAMHTFATLAAVMLVAGIGGIARAADRNTGFWKRLLPAGLLLGAVLGLACLVIDWVNAGRCFLGLTLIYAVFGARQVIEGTKSRQPQTVLTARLLIALLAAALLARMLLNGRLYHYGYYQAAVAGILIPAVIVGELPVRLALGRFGRALVVTAALCLLVPGVIKLAGRSQGVLGGKTYAIGKNVDLFYASPPGVDPKGPIVRALTDRLSQASSPGQTLIVLPEGVMINYLVRMPAPISQFVFFSAAISDGREQTIVDELRRHPPDWVAIISRDLREYDVRRYGEAPGKGKQILAWVADNYEQDFAVGGNPLDVERAGGILLRRKRGAS